MNVDDLARSLAEGFNKSSSQPRLPASTIARRLVDHFADLSKRHDFKPGDLVEWKPGLKNKRSPGPFLVSLVLDEPVFDTSADASSQYWREPLDVVLLHLARDGDQVDAIEHYFDSRRLRPYAGEIEEA